MHIHSGIFKTIRSCFGLLIILTGLLSCCPEYEPSFEHVSICASDFSDMTRRPICSIPQNELSADSPFIAMSATLYGLDAREEEITYRLYRQLAGGLILLGEWQDLTENLGRSGGTETCEFYTGYSWEKGVDDWITGRYRAEMEILYDEMLPALVVFRDFIIIE